VRRPQVAGPGRVAGGLASRRRFQVGRAGGDCEVGGELRAILVNGSGVNGAGSEVKSILTLKSISIYIYS
jgi:hypothetical protein